MWTSIDNDAINNGEYKWGTETYTNTTPGGTRSAWAVGGGEDGGRLDPASDGYPDNVDAWLIYGPVNMEDVIDAVLTFDYWLQADSGDTFGVYASTDGTRFQGVQVVDGGTGSWASVNHSLDGYVGESSVYIGFNFSSDDSGNGAR